MCLNKKGDGSCEDCRQRVAVESLLTIGQSQSCSGTTSTTPGTTQTNPAETENSNSNVSWQVGGLLTPPPSEAGSLSPPQVQSDDSSDLFATTHFNPLSRKTSKLAQVLQL